MNLGNGGHPVLRNRHLKAGSFELFTKGIGERSIVLNDDDVFNSVHDGVLNE